MKLEFCRQMFYRSSNFMKIRPVGPELLHADGRTGRHDEAKSRFSQFCEKRLKCFCEG